ncbi:MAG: hypothetical protein WBA57_13240 [Elainellaceae cyanobacterium]
MLKYIVGAGLAAIAFGVTAALPARAELAETVSPDEETIVGGRDVMLPSKPLTPIDYALPMEINFVTDSTVTTDTPITDSLYEDTAAWGEAISGCLVQTPIFVRETVSGDMPFIVGATAATIQLNANGNPVCTF